MEVFCHLGQSIQEWTKRNLWKTAFKKFHLVYSWILRPIYCGPFTWYVVRKNFHQYFIQIFSSLMNIFTGKNKVPINWIKRFLYTVNFNFFIIPYQTQVRRRISNLRRLTLFFAMSWNVSDHFTTLRSKGLSFECTIWWWHFAWREGNKPLSALSLVY